MKYVLSYGHLLTDVVRFLKFNTNAVCDRSLHERRGRYAEWIAAVFMIVKGYRILARRQRTPFGELDLIAVRGKRLAFVEVKLRRNHTEALSAIGRRQAGRMAQAAEHWVWQHRRYRGSTIGLDAVYVSKNALPHYAPDALQPIL